MSAFKRPFLDMVAELRRGRVNDDLTDKTHALIAACIDTGKKGSISLTLTFDPDKDIDDERFKVSDAIVVKTPTRSTKPSIFFVTRDGNFSRTDPNQDTFSGLSEVPSDEADDASDKKAKAN